MHNSTLSDTVVSNSTISDNGSGIYNDNGATCSERLNTTMSNNGVEIRNFNAPVVVAMSHTIFNVSPGGHSILNDFGTVTSYGYNVSSDDGGGYLNGPAIRSTPIRCLVLCRTTAALHSLMHCYRAAPLLMPAIRISSARLTTISVALVMIA